MTSHQPTKDYIARRTAEGLSRQEIIRCLKRYVARELLRQLQHAVTDPQHDTAELDQRAA